MRHIVQISLVVLMLLCLCSSCTEKNQIFEKRIFHPITLKPQNVFKDHPTFFISNRIIIDLTEDDRFTWKVPEDAAGYLYVQFVVYMPPRKGEQELPSSCQFSVWRQDGHSLSALSEKTYHQNDFIQRDGRYHILLKGMRIPVDLEKNTSLRFQVEISDKRIEEDAIVGITIPRIEKPLDETNLLEDIPNLLLISIDTLRPDYLGIYKDLKGQPGDFSFSPNLDTFSEQAVIFKNAYTPLSSTWPALASMHTSLYPNEHGVLFNRQQMNRQFDTLAVHMLDLGFCTLSLHGNASGLNVPGIERKFHYFNDDMAVVQSALNRLRTDSDRPFFHWYHFIGVHSNYKPPEWVMTLLAKDEPYRFYNLDAIMSGEIKVEPHELDYIRMLYAGELYNLDREINKIFDFLKINGLWDKTLILITADHGEDLYQHHNHFYHYPSLYETSLRIPLMVKFPDQKKRMIIKEPVSLIDIYPTLAEYFVGDGSIRENDHAFSGLSLIPLLKGKKKEFKERALYAGAENFEIISIIDKEWKLIHNPKNINVLNEIGLAFPYREFELYQPEKDTLEIHDLAEENLSVIRDLLKKIEIFKLKHKPLKGTENEYKTKTTKQFKKETLERLRALAYTK